MDSDNLLSIRHTGIVVTDMEKSLHFYRDLLGFKVRIDAREDSRFIDCILDMRNAKLHTVKLASPDGQMIELLDFGADGRAMSHPVNGTGLTHFAIQVRSAEEMYTFLKMNGLSFLSPPSVSPDGKAKVAFCIAPEGSYIEIVEILK